MQKMILSAVLFSALVFPVLRAPAFAAEKPRPELPLLAGEGQRNALPDGGWLTWNFSHRPRLGNLIMKVQVFDKAGAMVHPYEIVGEYGMPSMRYHDSGPVKFKLNKKGSYLLPVDLVMPGEWQVTIRVRSGKKEIYYGTVFFRL